MIERKDLIVFFMASVPSEMFGVQTKNTHGTRTPFLSNSNPPFRNPDPATRPTAPGGAEFSEQGKTLLATSCAFNKVELPINWNRTDFDQCQCVGTFYDAPAKAIPQQSTASNGQLNFSTRNAANDIIRIDQSPPELMRSVIRLHEMARADESEPTRKEE